MRNNDDCQSEGNDYEMRLDVVLGELRAILLQKHHDYGANNLMRRGLFGILVRVEDKLARIENLLTTRNSVSNETARDSWLDVAGYAIQAIVLFMELPTSEQDPRKRYSRLVAGQCPDCGAPIKSWTPSLDLPGVSRLTCSRNCGFEGCVDANKDTMESELKRIAGVA